MDLSDAEIRVLGCLLEKQRTTPDHYPLSLNSLRLACNQATNREPVVDYDDAVIRDALHRLERRGYTRLASGRGSRAAKYRHLLSQALPMSDGEQAIVCVLMLRGPQTPGELKQRSERLHAFVGLDGVHETLTALTVRGLVAQLGRRPGQKEERYAQQLGDSSAQSPNGAQPSTPTHIAGEGRELAQPPAAVASPDDLRDRVARLEREVAELRAVLTRS
ncbi:MAG TPA: YceH family protein [Solirubrobacteraceae bacterium]|nr:YceH family protein [Solirubrobacteraceae bacterium]